MSRSLQIPWTAACQVPLSSAISPSLLKFMFIESVMLSNHLVLCRPLVLLPLIFPSIRSLMNQLFTSEDKSIGVSASASVVLVNIQDWFPLEWTGLISCRPRDSQESSPTPQFKSINSSVLSFLSGPNLTSIYDCWKNHSFEYMNLF